MECGSYHDRMSRKTRESSRSLETGKAQVQRILDTLPDDASLEAIQYHIDMRQTIQQGWDERDRMISLDELQERVANWLMKWSSRAWSSAR